MITPAGTLPTPDDANLILRLYDLRRETKMRTAREWFLRRFHAASLEEMTSRHPPGSDESAYLRMVTSYWDMAASFVVSGILNRELFLQSNRECLLVWEKMKHLVPEVRVQSKDPSYLHNLEIVGNAFMAHLQSLGPETYPAFVARVATMRA